MPLQQDYNKTSTLLLTKIFNEISLLQPFKSGEFSQTLDCVYFLALFLLQHHSIYSAAAAKSLVVSNSVRPHRRQPTRLRCPWDSPGKNTGVDCHFLLQCMKVKSESEVTQSCPTLSDPTECSPPGSSVHGIFQARVLEWGAIAFSTIYSNIAIKWFPTANPPGKMELYRLLLEESSEFEEGHIVLSRTGIQDQGF